MVKKFSLKRGVFVQKKIILYILSILLLFSFSQFGIAASNYDLKIVVKTTSDWTDIQTISGETVANSGYKVVLGEVSAIEILPGGGDKANYIVHMGRRQSDQSLWEGEFFVILDNLKKDSNIQFLVTKGDLGYTIVDVYDSSGNQLSYLNNIGSSGDGKNAKYFFVNSSSIHKMHDPVLNPLILFDDTHLELRSISKDKAEEYYMTWNYQWDSSAQFSDYSGIVPWLESLGFRIKQLNEGELSYEIISNSSVLVFLGGRKEPSSREKVAINRFVTTGGNLLLTDCRDLGCQSLAEMFKIPISWENVRRKNSEYYTIRTKEDPDINIENIRVIGPPYIKTDSQLHVLLASPEDSYVDLNNNKKYDFGEPSGSFPVLAYKKIGSGKIIVLGESYIFNTQNLEAEVFTKSFFRFLAQFDSNISSMSEADNSQNIMLEGEPASKDSSIVFSEGLKYFSVMLLISLVILGIAFFYDKIDKNKLKFRNDLRTKHWYVYYFALIGNSIIGIIWLIMTFTVSFKELPLNFDQGKFFFLSVIFFLSISSFILAVSLLKSRPVLKLNGLHFLISLLIGLLFLFILLTNPQDSMPFFIPVLLLMSSAISVWYHRIAVFKPPSHELVMEQKDAEVSIPMINITRGYSVLPNNDIKFGIRLTNETGYTITNVDMILDYSEELFNLKDSKIQSSGNIMPDNARTTTYFLKPLGCIHNEQINAIITYKDHTGKKQTLHMRPKEVHCVCPFLK